MADQIDGYVSGDKSVTLTLYADNGRNALGTGLAKRKGTAVAAFGFRSQDFQDEPEGGNALLGRDHHDRDQLRDRAVPSVQRGS
jgi:hypothetical protein